MGSTVRKRSRVRKLLHSPILVYYQIRDDKRLVEVLHFRHGSRQDSNGSDSAWSGSNDFPHPLFLAPNSGLRVISHPGALAPLSERPTPARGAQQGNERPIGQTIRYFAKNEDPIGKRFGGDVGARTEGRQIATIVGVIGDTRELGLARDTIPEVTVSALQWPRFAMTIVLRTSKDPLSLVSAVRTQVSDVDKSLPIFNVQTMDDVLSAEIVSQRFNAVAVAGFAGLAVLLAAVGIYGVTAHAVSQRTHEMGVRIALGAGTANVLRMVLNQGLSLALIGVGLGLAASIGLTRLMRGLLFRVNPFDPETYVLVIAALLAIAATACYIPSPAGSARRPGGRSAVRIVDAFCLPRARS
jgi:hypothetical protein